MTEDWQQILSDFGPDVWRTIRSLVGNEADARDCYQVVFLDAFRYSKKHRVDNWKALLKRMARLRALDQLRRKYRQSDYFDDAQSTAEAVSSEPSPDARLRTAELSSKLREGLGELTPQQAEAFVMRYVDQLSYDEIAERLASNRNAIGAILSRARKQLRIVFSRPSTGGVRR